MQSGPSGTLRYERKFLIKDYPHTHVEQMILFHPACFNRVYTPRSVNNIYFDTCGLNYYYDNIDGESQRQKVRIRWYGAMFGLIGNPVLEYKIKNGLLGEKKSFKMAPFQLDKNFSVEQISQALKQSSVSSLVNDEVTSLRPTLLNNYKRKYFLSADKKIRLTIDHDLTYYGIRDGVNLFTNRSTDHYSTVLEMKYDPDDEPSAMRVANDFPFALTKSSKYLQGLERVLV